MTPRLTALGDVAEIKEATLRGSGDIDRSIDLNLQDLNMSLDDRFANKNCDDAVDMLKGHFEQPLETAQVALDNLGLEWDNLKTSVYKIPDHGRSSRRTSSLPTDIKCPTSANS